MRPRRLGRLRSGVSLVTDAHGDVRYSDEVAVGQYGKQKGQLIPIDELDEPGRHDLKQPGPGGPQEPPGPRTGEPRQVWRLYDENGDPV